MVESKRTSSKEIIARSSISHRRSMYNDRKSILLPYYNHLYHYNVKKLRQLSIVKENLYTILGRATEVCISKETAFFLLHYELLDLTKVWVMCKGYANDEGEYVEILKEDGEDIADDPEYKDFSLWLNFT